MKNSIKKGISFGLTSGIITTLGLIIGLYSSTKSKLIILSGIFVIAVADALSDSIGIHISEEAEKNNSKKEVWESTFSTFISKFIFALSFAIPIIFLELKTAIIISSIWGIFLIGCLSVFIAKEDKYKVVAEHLAITIFVIIATYFIGKLAGRF